MTELARKIADLDPEQLEFLRRRLARSARKQGEETGPAGLPRVPRRPAGGDPPLSFAQQRLWFLHRLQASAAAYHVPISVDLRGALVPAALDAALDAVVRRHEALRTAFPLVEGRPVQAISGEARASLSWVDLSALAAPARGAELARLGEEEGLRPFDLERGPLLRGLVVRGEPRRCRLLLTLHHIAADNWSVAVLMREVAELYNAALEGRAPALTEPPVQYADYAVWQRDWLQGPVLERQLGFWRETMAGAPPRLDLPTDRPRPGAPSFRSGRQVFRIPADLVREVRSLGRRHGTTLYIVLLAAFKALLHRYTGQEDLVVGSPVANRRRPELEGLIGFFVNTLLMRNRAAPAMTFEELLTGARESALASYAHQDLPFERLVEELRPERDTTYQPLFQVMFNLFDGVLPELRLAGLEVAAVEVQIGTWNDLDLLLVDREDGLDGYLRYGADLYDPATIEAFAASFRSLLEQVVRAPQARLAELRLTPALTAQAGAARRRDRKRTVAASATFTADPVEEALAFWMQEMGIPAEVALAPYNQVFQQLLDPSSLLATNRDGFNVVLVRLEDWVRDRAAEDGKLEAVERNAKDLTAALARAAGRAPVPWVVVLCPPSPAAAADAPFAALQADLARRMAASWEEIPHVDFVGPEELGALYPGLELHDAYADEIGHVPYSTVGFAALATLLARRVSASVDPPYKVIAVDCDQTLWRGVCAEDGPAGVVVGPAQRWLQDLLVERQRAGLLLCLCSKNEERDVWDVFDARPDMPLRRQHVTAWRIDWGAKSDNLRALAADLGLGLDSFIFLDDNPVECAEVRSACPEVAVIQVPAEDGALPGALRAFWGLDRRRVTAEDRRRTALYRENLERERGRRQAGGFEEFLAGLELRVEVAPLGDAELPRAAQLTQRTSQLNTTTVRRGEAEIRSLLDTGALEGRTVRVRDRFGDYGLVGLLLFRTEGDALAVGSLLLSCRVLGRRVEHRLLAHLGEIAGERGLSRVDVPAVPTARNRPVLDFLESVAGAWREEAPDGGRVYRIPVDAARTAERAGAAAAPAAGEEDERPAARADGEAAARTGRLLRFARELADPAEVARRAEAGRRGRRRGTAPEGAPAAPCTATEQRLAALFAEVLGRDRVGVAESFFAAGGHSLLGVTLLSRVRQAFAVDLPLSALFEAPTVAALAARLEAEGPRAGASLELPPLRRAPEARHEPYPLTDVQQAYWLGRSGTMALGRVSCHVYNEMDFPELDPGRFASAWRRLVRRHDALRTVFLSDGRQRVLAAVPDAGLPILDLRGETPKRAAGRLLEIRDTLSHQVLPADRWPLYELRISLLPGGRTRLHVSFDLLIADAWSFQILQRELLQLYVDPAAEPPPLDITFRDYVLTLEALEETEPWRASRDFWAARLATLPPPPDLPLARAPEAAGGRFVRRSAELPAADWALLRQRAGQAGLTPSAVLLTAYAEALGTWSRRRRFSLVLTLFNRLAFHPQVIDLVGDFTSLTLLEIDLAGEAGFAERARQVQRRLWEDLDHRFYSSVRVVRDLIQSQGWSARSALPVVFTSTLTMEGKLVPPAGLRPEMAWFITQTPQVLIDQQVSETLDGELAIAWDVVEDLFPPGLMDDLFGAWCRRLRWLCGAADWSVPGPSLVPGEQLARRAAVNATESPLAEQLLHDGFRKQARHRPGAPAVLAPGRTLSYGELDRLASRTGRRLRELGARPGHLVGVVLDKGWEQAVAVLGVLTAGAAYLPIDPGLPRERVRRLLELGEAGLAITRRELDASLDWPPSVRRLCLDRDEDWAAAGAEPAAPAPGWSDLAYVIFTSGSTGEPKGVAIDHRGAWNTVHDINHRFAIGPDDRVLALSALNFDLSVWDLFGPLSAGGAVVMPAAAQRLEPAHWLERMSAGGVTVWNTVPALLQMLVDWAEGRPGALPGALRLALLSGDWIPVSLPDRARILAEGLRVVGLGGATEASIWSIVFPIEAVDPGWRSIPYGRPLANQTFHVLDAALAPPPDWVPGELFIGGIGLAREYWRDAARTEERFFVHPATGERLYRTGDLGRWLPDATIEFLGREDLQVKIQGHRIELGEIEAALVRCPGVRDAAVTVAGDPKGERRLVGHVVAAPGAAPAEDELRAFLGERLPSYMVPASFLSWDEMPLTANGKVDRGRLASAGSGAAGARRADYEPPRNPVEEMLAGIWTELLGAGRVGIHDDLFDLGAHSLLATQLLARVNRAFGVELPLRAIFAAPTVAGLAVEVRRALDAPEGRRAPPIVAVPRDRRLPLSFAQQRIWFFDQLEPGSPLYNIPAALRVEGPLRCAVLASSLGEVVRRHEILRTVYVAPEGVPAQVIQPAPPFSLPLVDLSGLPGLPARTDWTERGDLRARQALALAEEEAGRPFDLARGPLPRVTVLRLGAQEHLLLLTLHHIAGDGRSMGILVRELTALYAAFVTARPASLPELPVQYVDFAGWQRSWLSGDVLEQEIAWWRLQLAGLPPLLELPADRARPAAQSFRGAIRPIALPARLTLRMEALARHQGGTLFMALLAGFQVLLARHSGQNDLAAGCPVAGRNRVEIEGLIGFFVNTLVMRGNLAGGPSFRELIGRVQETALAAYLHQDVPFEKLVEELAPERSLAQAPLFQVMLALQEAPAENLEIGLRLQPLDPRGTTAKFDLTVSLAERGGGLGGMVEYATDLFDATTIDRLANHYEKLLTAALETPEQRVCDLPLLGETERHQALAEWNDTEGPRCRGHLLHDLFEAQAARTPDAPAAVFHGEALTYAALDARAGRLARHLRRLGCVAESRVGVALERSLDLMVSLLGVLKAGAAYVPLDPDYPRDRLAFVLKDAAPRVLITQTSLCAALPPAPGTTVLCLDGGPLDDGRGEPVPGDDRQLAYVLYTSGSTGRPKGVGVSHRALVSFLASMRQTPGFSPGERLLAVTSLSFDIAALEIFLPLTVGGCVELASRAEAADGALLAARLRASGAVVLQATPATWRMLLDSGWTGDPTLRALCGGEALPRELAASLAGRARELWNLYGPTETTVWSATARIRPWETGPVSIGRPIADTQIHLLDAQLRIVPLGATGELWIGGAGLSRGYLGRPDLTAERFLPNPLAAEAGEPGGRLYRTGDLARLLPGGRMEVLGRIDHQVKVRGFRIELGEIEAVLVEQPEVREAVVVARESATGDRRLVAYVAGGSWVGSEGALRQALRERLPDYMVPTAFVMLSALPLTPNGKVDRKALPAPQRQSSEDTCVAPRTPVEEALCGIWAEVLGLERVGVTDHFFELGGHSLLATQVMSRLRSVFAIEMPLRDLFAAPGLADLAARVEAARRTGSISPAPPLLPVPRQGSLPLSFAQQRLWLIDQLEPGSPLYNIPSALRVEGPLDTAVLASCLGEIVRRHEALRTVFATLEGSPVQVIQPAAPFVLPVADLSGLPEKRRAAETLLLVSEEAGRPFDLTRGPLLRGLLLRSGDCDHAVALTLHHIVSDAWSMGILVREIAALYPAFLARRPSPLPALPVQYADFAAWQTSWLQGGILERELAFWRAELAGLPPLLDLPADRLRPALRSYRGATRPVRLPAELLRQVSALGRREGATLFMVLLAGLQVLLARYSGQERLAIGSPVANRNRVEIEGLIGFFVNTLVLRCDLTGHPAFRDLLAQVRETALAAYMHQDLPFEKVVEELAPERSLAHTPLFQVVFALQNAPVENLEIQDLHLQPVGGAEPTAKFDLTLILAEQGGGLAGTVEYATDLFDAATVDRLILHFEHLLAAALEAPRQMALELPLLTGAERHQLLLEWGGKRTELAAALTLHRGFAARARLAPDAPALTCGEVTLSYGELHRRSNRLARWLRGHGAGPESRVGLCLDRSVDLVVGILGVLKAGAAYVPLDPGLPRERLSFILEDAEIRIVVGVEELARLEGLPAGDLEPLGDASSLAYVIYTSGSTGRPKGALITHGNVVRLFEATADWFGFGEGDVWTLFHSYAFDFSVWEIWGALLYGGRLVIVPWEVSRSPELFLDLLERERVTVLNQTPSAFAQLAQVEARRGSMATATALRWVIFGGEALEPASLEPWFARHGDACPRLVNMYGITETTVHVTWRPLSAADARGGHRSMIGAPIADLSLAAMDRSLRPVPIGVPGELVVGGAGLARGYLGRPELTAERFVPDPAGGPPGERLYRSGDLCRFLPHGDVEYLGRLDHQVKVRGFRIELGEIEAVLAALPGVREAVVVARESPAGDRRLVAYVTGGAAVEELRRSLLERLPDYMVPAAFVPLAALPLTPNGKVDRKALPAPDAHGAGEDHPLAPRTPVEELLAGIWAEVLGLERVGADDHFFDLGGHSLLATRVMSSLRGAFGVEMPLRELFEAPRLSELAARIEATLRAGAGPPAPPLEPIAPVPRRGPLPLSFAQQRLWFIDQLEPGSPLYNIPAALRVEGSLDGAVLARCLGEIVRRHEVLRTVFAAPKGVPLQVIQPARPFPLPVVDLTGLPDSAREALILTLAREESVRPFDLGRGPLLRGVLLRLAAEDHVVALTMHHIVSDGWSMGLLVREITALYTAFAEGRKSPLPDLPIQYADFAVWQRGWLDREALERLVEHWRQRLAGAPPQFDLPGARPRPEELSPRGAARRRRFSPPLLEQLRALGRRESATLFMTLLASLQALLVSRTGASDLVVGTDVAGRDRSESEGLIGCFINQLPLRADLTGDPTLCELLGRVRRTALEAYAHQDLPFDHLVEALRVEQSLRRSPVFQVKLVLQNAPRESLELPGLTLKAVDLSTETAQLDLHWSFLERGEGLWLTLTYSTDLYDEPLIDEVLGQYEIWLHAFAERPEARLSHVAAGLAQAEQDRLAERGLELKSKNLGKLLGRRGRQSMEV